MNRMKNVLTLLVVLLILLSSFAVYPDYSHGRSNTINMYSFKTHNDKYLSAKDGGGSILTADKNKIGEWEKFEVIDLGKGYVALKSYDGYYISVSNDEKSINVNSDEIGKKETFELIRLENNKVAIRTYNDKFISLENGSGKIVVANRKEVGKWGSFELIKSQETDHYRAVLSATATDKGITFTWTKPRNNRNIIGYNLYRGIASGKQSNTPVTDFPIEGTSYTDYNLKAGTKYYYILKAVYKDKTLGPASNEVSVILKSNIALSAKTAEDGINLYWNKPKNSSDIIGYNLYRGTASGKQSATPITDFPVEGTSYTDKNIKNNTTYYYILKPVYRDKTLGQPSNEVAVKSNFGRSIVLQVGSRYMYVNERKQEIDPGKGTEVVLINSRTFLPIRAVIEAMGGEVEWNQSDKRVSIYLNDNTIYLWIGKNTAKVNGVTKETDVVPYISDTNRTMLPLRFIVENLDCEVDWDGLTKKVTIRTRY